MLTHTSGWPKGDFDPVLSIMPWCIQIHTLTALKSIYKITATVKKEREKVCPGSFLCSFLRAVKAFITFITLEQNSMGRSICC